MLTQPGIEGVNARLAELGEPSVDDSVLTRALYSTDASLYRVVPAGVVQPRSVAELEGILQACREARVPVTGRGAGTSCAGNAVGPGVVVDLARHLTRVESIDPAARIAVVEPGVVQAQLQDAVTPHGLRFGPDPSTYTRCTIGGMIGNNACGPRALGYGRTADNIVALEVVTGTGERLKLDSRQDARESGSETLQALWGLVSQNLGVIRREFGRHFRQVSGYSLEHLLPENGFNVARFFAGTEGTLGIVTRATVRLVEDAPFKTVIALGYPSMPEAADAMPAILPFEPTACEGMDRRIVEVVERRLGADAVPRLPAGDGWVFVELADTDAGRLAARAAQLAAASGALAAEVVTDPVVAAALWKIRADGAGLAGVSLERQAHAGWEDAAVPPERLGDYLRAFDALLTEHHLSGLPYGHFGDGCVHCRIDFPLNKAGGRRAYRAFIEAAADLVARHGGSMSGEHGDGRARSELLPRMYSPAALDLFAQVKNLFDPDNLVNPGVLVEPRPFDSDLRDAGYRNAPLALSDPRFTERVHHCTGVGKCVARELTEGVMCPSFQATRREQDSTRGRARILQEMINGTFVTGGWRAPEVREALDLCLSCKGCARDCPTGTDMAGYKARVLHESYRRRLRPRDHYALGWLPRWGRLVTRLPVVLPGLANALMNAPVLRDALKALAGLDRRRGGLPRFASRSQRRMLRREALERATPGSPKPVLVWVDSFSDAFEGTHLPALVSVLDAAGYTPEFLDRTACCGLTWISTGQLDGAARELRRAIEVLHPYATRGVPIVGSEPSCVAVWRGDAADLVDDPRVAEVAANTPTLAELLAADPHFTMPDLSGHTIVAQPHCHHASVIGWDADAALLARSGATVIKVPGCCGLAGNFGMQQGHFDVSVAVFNQHLGRALVQAPEDEIVLADGFSCRTQLRELAGRQALTLAELIAAHHPGIAR